MFKFLKKKKKESMALPPPLPPEEEVVKKPIGDLPPIFAEEELPIQQDLPELQFPAIPEEVEEMPKMPPLPNEMPIAPTPAVQRAFPKKPVAEHKIFDKTIEEELPTKRVIRPRLKPIFVGVDEYKRIINNTNVIRSKLLEAEDFAKKLNHLKHEESKILSKWHSKIEDIDKKLTYMDKVVSKAQG